jgi:hypothetical protein
VQQEIAALLCVAKTGIVSCETGLDHGPEMVPAFM